MLSFLGQQCLFCSAVTSSQFTLIFSISNSGPKMKTNTHRQTTVIWHICSCPAGPPSSKGWSPDCFWRRFRRLDICSQDNWGTQLVLDLKKMIISLSSEVDGLNYQLGQRNVKGYCPRCPACSGPALELAGATPTRPLFHSRTRNLVSSGIKQESFILMGQTRVNDG